VLKEQVRAKNSVETWDGAQHSLEDAETMLELAREASDDGSAEEARTMSVALDQRVGAMEFARMLSGPNDHFGALVEINAGAGGTDSQDWAEMLLRMYLRWGERHSYKAELIDRLDGEEAGIKSATLVVEGQNAFGFLRAEAGVHRLVRISPFDANARRQTAFASVAVYPDIEDSVKVDIKEEDLKIDVFRSGGAGGQHVNKTESAVRITHLPTGIVVVCQNERSQHKNKAQALRVLRARLFEHEMDKKEAEMAELNAQKKAIAFGSQIRSYVLAPYRMVSDHRTELKVGNVDAVLDGDLDEFIHAYLLSAGSAPTARA
jgi:peptide chain release factor 2